MVSFIPFKLYFNFSFLLSVVCRPEIFPALQKIVSMNNYLGKELMDVWVLSVPELVGFVCSHEMPNELFLSQTAECILSPMGFGKPPKQSC